MKKLLAILILSFAALQALDLDEMIYQQKYDEMSPAECKILLSDNTEINICSDGSGISELAEIANLIQNNFYSSYIKFIRSKLDTKDKKEFEKLIKQMLEELRLKQKLRLGLLKNLRKKKG